MNFLQNLNKYASTARSKFYCPFTGDHPKLNLKLNEIRAKWLTSMYFNVKGNPEWPS